MAWHDEWFCPDCHMSRPLHEGGDCETARKRNRICDMIEFDKLDPFDLILMLEKHVDLDTIQETKHD